MNTDPRKILLFGAGGLAADILDLTIRAEAGIVAGFVVDDLDGPREVCGLPVLAWRDIKQSSTEFRALNAMGRPSRREFIERAEDAGFEFIGVRDPSAVIFPSAVVEDNAVIGAGVIIAARARVGRHAFLNRAVLVGHHTVVEEFVSLQAGAKIGGYSRLHADVEVGIGATIIDRITIGARTRIGGGAVIQRDCPTDVTMIGLPARVFTK